MENKKVLWIGVMVAIVIAALGLQFPKVQQAVLGAVPTLDGVDNPYYSIGGVRFFNYRQNISATSSVICIQRNPFTGTSTLESYSVQVTSNGIAAAQNLYVSTTTGTAGYGSSTPAIMSGFAAGTGQFTAIWGGNTATGTANVLTTVDSAVKADLLPGVSNTGASNYIVGPLEYVTTRVATATPRTLDTYYTGMCRGVFREI